MPVKLPIAHPVQAVALSSENVPAKQEAHLVLAGAPDSVENVPATQFRQVPLVIAPRVVE
jgi:hypothetical protein